MLAGGEGDDVFVFTGGGGNDVILDFEVGVDTLCISNEVNCNNILNPEDLLDFQTQNDDNNAVIDFGHGDTITLVGVSPTSIQDSPDAFFNIAS